jgi:dihydroorotate dehydrogenase (fumarate)
MSDLRTRYLGLELRSPLVASASPLTGRLEDLRRLEAAGAAAVVLPSLFQEQLAATTPAARPAPAAELDLRDYNAGPIGYLRLIEQAKQTLRIPVIASLNGIEAGPWVEHAAMLEQAGADALELNLYHVSSHPGRSGAQVEWQYLELVRAVRRQLGIPLAVKLSPYLSAVANFATQLVEAGAQGLVLFNRFYQPDLDPETFEVTPQLALSTSEELRLPLRWIGILAGKLPASLAATTGIHTTTDVVKVLAAGADVAMTTSALLRHGPEHLAALEAELAGWLDGHQFASVAELRGRASQRALRDPSAYERANYVQMLASYPSRRQPIS